MHLDLDDALAAAGFAAPAFDVEREAPRLVAADACLRHLGKGLADLREYAGVRGRVGARRSPDRRLIDVDHLVQVLQAADLPVPAWPVLGSVQVLGQTLVQDLIDERALAASRHAGDAHERTQGDAHVNVPQVVLARAGDLQELAVAVAAPAGHADLPPAG